MEDSNFECFYHQTIAVFGQKTENFLSLRFLHLYVGIPPVNCTNHQTDAYGRKLCVRNVGIVVHIFFVIVS